VLAVVVIAEMRAPLDKNAELYVLGNLMAFFGLFLVWHATFYALGLYDAQRPRQIFEKIQRLVMAGAVNLGLGVGYFYLLILAVSDFLNLPGLRLSLPGRTRVVSSGFSIFSYTVPAREW
jgi:hypothetical protein